MNPRLQGPFPIRTRRHVLQLLRQKPMTAGELAENFTIAKPTLSAHFAILREADLIEPQEERDDNYLSAEAVGSGRRFAGLRGDGGRGASWRPETSQSREEKRMIDRKAFWISSALVFVMLVAAVWRVSHLAHVDATAEVWRGRAYGNSASINSLVLLVEPGTVFFIVARLAMRGWLAKASDEALQPWKKWSAFVLVAYQRHRHVAPEFYVIARSFEFLDFGEPAGGGGLALGARVSSCCSWFSQHRDQQFHPQSALGLHPGSASSI